MKRINRRVAPAKKARKQSSHIEEVVQLEPIPKKEHIDNSPLIPKTESQKKFLNAISSSDITYAIGPAGVGKTFLATAYAAKELVDKRIDTIIITRPAVEAEEELGFLPGTLGEKFDPYLHPFIDVLNMRLGKSFTEYLINNGKIIAKPLGFMRGMTFRNCVVILDEAQNTLPGQMKMFLTRLGPNSKIIINGDLDQSDLTRMNGLEHSLEKIAHLHEIRVVEFESKDVVRHGLVQKIVEAYSKEK